MDELPHYRSFGEENEEEEELCCILCKQNINDPIELGDKLTYENITIHHYCAVRYPFNFNKLMFKILNYVLNSDFNLN